MLCLYANILQRKLIKENKFRRIMTELMKDHLSYENIITLAERISANACVFTCSASSENLKSEKYLNFNVRKFEEKLVEFFILEGAVNWAGLSLMQRIRVSAQALYSEMPEVEGANVIISTLHENKQLSGWLSLICCEYIAINNNLTIDQGLSGLKEITEYFSAEFAIRALLLKSPIDALAILTTWLNDENEHVRRLISEGTRPRLPWGVRLPIFIQQPELVMPLLIALRDDPSEYVRRSVANHLNDISKDHPELVIQTAQDWLSKKQLGPLSSVDTKHRLKMIRHACRTLFKQGEPRVMALFGYQPAADIRCTLSSDNITVPFEGVFEFDALLESIGSNDESSASIQVNAQAENKLMIDYVIHFQKANGKQAPKVFKWLDRTVTDSVLERATKRHSFKKISTRKYYPGSHMLEVMVNGVKKAQLEFELLKPLS
jgi:3-methyladenine DNA glycosylase AlkC